MSGSLTPVQGKIDNLLSNVPQELRALARWIVWRPREAVDEMTGERRTNKIPYSLLTKWDVDPSDPTAWLTFDDAVEAFRNLPELGGIGLFLLKEDGFFIFEFDNIKRVKAAKDLENRRRIESDVKERLVTYAEKSFSGNGTHYVARGMIEASQGKYRSPKLEMELFLDNCFVVFTGDVLPDRNVITDQQDFLHALRPQFGGGSRGGAEIKYPGFKPALGIEDDGEFRHLDLSDEEVITRAAKFDDFLPRYNNLEGCMPGEWSESFFFVMAKLDYVTGSSAQVERLLSVSPMVREAPPTFKGETRLRKFKRRFWQTFEDVRVSNWYTVYGRKMGNAILSTFEGQRKEQRAEREKAMADLASLPESRLSKSAADILDHFDEWLEFEHRARPPPPGMLGRIVKEVEGAMFQPFTRFAIPATIAGLAGIFARRYKLPSKHGVNVAFALITYTAAGKSDAIAALKKIMRAAVSKAAATPSGPARDFILMSDSSSVQGIWHDFMNKPCCAWMINESDVQLNKMSHPSNETDRSLKNLFNDLHDVSKFGEKYSISRSAASRKAELNEIDNLCVSTFWVTTKEKFRISERDAYDGFLSRVAVIRHEGNYGDPNENSDDYVTPDWLVSFLKDRINEARQFDDSHATASETELHTVSIANIKPGLHWEITKSCAKMTKAANLENIPQVYTALSRLPMIALRIAGVMAIAENPYQPVITIEQYKWAFGYLLQNTLSLLSDIEAGKVGSRADDPVSVIIRAVKKLLRDDEKKKRYTDGIPWSTLRDKVHNHKAFVEHKLGITEGIERTLAVMNRGQIEIEERKTAGKRGPTPRFIHINRDDPCWGLTDAD